jgi:hypothetical protein
VKLGGLVALLILCTLDHISLTFIFLSMALLQLNSVMIIMDKYVTELDGGGTAVGFRNPALRMFLARDGQRILIMMLPFFFVPFRLAAPVEARWTAAVVAALIVIPGLLRAPARALSEKSRLVAASTDPV